MKKTVAFLLAALLILGLCACGGTASDTKSDSNKIQIVTTIFPIYDWVRTVTAGTDAQVTMLLDSGVDLHSFQPSAQDILKVATCDVFLYVGGESDAWVEDALKTAANTDMTVLDLMEVLGDLVKEEETVEGMEAEAEEEEEGEEEPEYDEHIWLSLKNAAVLTDRIAEALAGKDPAHAGTYRANAAAYAEKLRALDEAYAKTVADASVKTLLFGDRFPFRYLCDDYGLAYYAAFSGCSAETEASFETVAFLAGKVEELGLGAVLTIEGTDHRIAETIVQNTRTKDQRILTLDSLQSVTAKDVQSGASYLAIMEQNLSVLREALAVKG